MMSSNVVGFTKKTTNYGIVFVAMGGAYFIGPQVFRDGPHYQKANYATIGMWFFSIMLLALNWSLNWRENKKRDQMIQEEGIDVHAAGVEFLDLTDKENKLFRYVL